MIASGSAIRVGMGMLGVHHRQEVEVHRNRSVLGLQARNMQELGKNYSRSYLTVFSHALPSPLTPPGVFRWKLLYTKLRFGNISFAKEAFLRIDALREKTRQDIYNSASSPFLLNLKPFSWDNGGSVVGLLLIWFVLVRHSF